MTSLIEPTDSGRVNRYDGQISFPASTSYPVNGGLVAVLRQRMLLLGGLMAAGCLAGMAYGLYQPKVFRATASILYNAQDTNPWEMVASVPTERVLPEEIETQLSILRSASLARRTLSALGEDMEDADEPSPIQKIIAGLRSFAAVRFVEGWFGIGTRIATDLAADARPEEDRRLKAFEKALTVKQDGRSHVILVEFVHSNPKRAAAAANAVADSYVERGRQQSESTYVARREWVTSKLLELDAEIVSIRDMIEARHAVLQAEMAGDRAVATTSRREIEQEWSEALNRQSDIRAALETMQQATGVNHLSAALLGEAFVARASELEMQQIEIERRLAQSRQTLGAQHPKILELLEEQRALRQRTVAERSAAELTLSGELAVLERRTANLKDRLDSMRLAGNASADAERELALLGQRLADKQQLRSRYEGVAMDLAQAEHRVTPKASILSPATIPIRPDKPSPILTSGLGAASMLFGGILLVAIRALSDRRINQIEDIREALGFESLGALPRLSRGGVRAVSAGSSIKAGHAQYFESLRMILASLLAKTRSGSGTCVVCVVTSALPGEGKSVLALTLARSAEILGKRTLHLDIDLRKRRPIVPTAHYEPAKSRNGEFRNAQISDGLGIRWASSGVKTVATASFQGPQDVCLRSLHDGSIGRYIDNLRSNYDLIIVDTPPILGFSDASVLAECADMVLLSVKAHETEIETVAAAVDNLSSFRPLRLSFVLNFVDPKRTRTRRVGHLGPHRRLFRNYYRPVLS